MDSIAKNKEFHQRLESLVGTEEPFRWAKRMEIPVATFARIWNNYDIPKHEHLCRIAQKCEISLDWLLMGKDELSEKSFSMMPLIGMANCGIAQGWYNENESASGILLPSSMNEENAFAVLCRGQSMIPAGIRDGDVCIVYPNRTVEPRKPALIRTKNYVKGKEVSLVTVKLFDSQDDDFVFLSGWLDPDETGVQNLFTEKRSKSCITLLAPVGNVLSIKFPEMAVGNNSGIDKEVLVQCLETLHPLYKSIDSQKFSQAILFLYENILKNGSPNMKTISDLMRIIG